MFDQPGKKIKKYASWMFWVIAALVGFRLVLVVMEAAQWNGDASALPWELLVCVAAILSTYLIMLVLYAVGDIAEETARQTTLFEQNNELLSRLVERTTGVPSGDCAPMPEPETVPTPVPTPEAAPAPTSPFAPVPDPTPKPKPKPRPLNQGQTRCPQCGTVQSDAREKCYNCGTPLKSE